jgi:serine/threonine-protein kinase
LEVVIALSSGAEVVLKAEIVRAVASAEAANWGLQPGMALQITNLDGAARRRLEAMARGSSVPDVATHSERPAANVHTVERLISRLEGKLQGSPYDALSIPPSSDESAIRDTLRRLLRETDPTGMGRLSGEMTSHLQALQERIKAAAEPLLDPVKRAEFDASKGNYFGVAAALRSGLRIDDMAKLRRNYLASHAGAEAQAQPHLTQAVLAEREGRVEHALAALEKALKCDPLNIGIHQRYWAVMHKKKS